MFSYLSYKEIDELSEKSPAGANYLIFNPSLAGGSSIDVTPNIKGGFVGLSLSHTQADIVKATLEGIAMDLKNAYDVLAQRTFLSENLLFVGGGAKSRIWLEIYASIFAKDVVTTDILQDAASLGAAAIAFVGAGIWQDYNKVKQAHKNAKICKPKNIEAYKKVHTHYNRVKELMGGFADEQF